ncbi:MAG: PAS domain S-box protein [Cyanobacteria bacterium J06621_15]
MTEPINPYIKVENPENHLSQSFLLGIINSVSDPIFVKNRQHQWIFFNNAFRQLTGYDSKELIGKSDYDFFSSEEAEIFRETDELIFSSGVSDNSEAYFPDNERKFHFVSIQKTLINDELGNQFIICSFKEIEVSEPKLLREEKLNNISLCIVKAINNLLSISDFDKSLYAFLETLGTATDVQQVSIVAVNDNRSWKWSNNNFDIELDIFLRWHSILVGGEIIIGSIDDFPESEREILNAANIVSILVIPIKVRENLWGYIRFDNCQKEDSWLDSEKSILQAAGESLGAAIFHHQQQEKLVKSKHFLQLVVDSIPQIIFWKDCNSVFLGCNQRLADIWGLSSVEEIAGKTDNDVPTTPREKSQWYREWDKRVIESGVPELHIVEKKQQADGKQKWLDTNKIPLLDEKNNIVGLLATIEDITERKQVEEALRESEENFQKLSTNVPGMLYKFKMHPDGSMSFPYVSTGSYELLGIAAERIQAESNLLISRIHPEDYKTFEKSLNNSAETLEAFYWEGRLVQSSEKTQWVKTESRPEKQSDGSIIWDGFLSDITHLKKTKKALQKAYAEMESLVLERTKELTRTNKVLQAEIEERKNTEAVLRETEAKVQKLAANVPGMLYQFEMKPDGSMSFPYVSPGCYEIYGLEPEQIEADADYIFSMTHPEDLKAFKNSCISSAKNLNPWGHEGRIVLASGEVRWIKSHSRPEKLENGTILYHGFILDITERKQAEKALLRSNAMLEAQQEAAIDGILFVDENQNILSCNQQFVDLWQIPQSVIETGDEQQFLASMIDKFANLGEFVNEVENLYNDAEKSVRDEIDLGDGRTFERYCAPVNSVQGEYFGRVWYFRDISERKAAEKSLLRTNSVLKAQQEASIDGILVVDEFRESISYNQRFIDLWQIPKSTIETGKHEAIFASILDKLKNPEEFVCTLEYLFEHPDESCRNEIYLKDGKTLERYIASVLSFTGDNYGKIFYFRDITERKQAEAKLRQQTQELENALQQLQNAQVQLIQSEKMSSLGQLVAGIAHEINNPVNFIEANLTYVQEYFEDLLDLIKIYQYDSSDNLQAEEFTKQIEFDYLQEDLPNIISSMKTGAKRIGDIVLSLRTFSRLDEAEFKTIDIHESIDSTLMVLQNSLEPKLERVAIVVTKEFNDLPLVECFAGKLNQVFLNILNNAIYALEEAIKNNKFSQNEYPHIRISTQLIRQDTVQINIIDNGCGIPKDNINRLFDPFFTTKPVGQGTGLGLSISYQIIVEHHKGKLNCISTVGKGSEFQIKIPVKGTSK